MKITKKKASFIMASWFGAGYAPKMPGTVGSFCALPFIWFFAKFLGLPGLLFFAAATFVLGIIASREVLKYTKHDPRLIVIDEVSGQTLSFMFVLPAIASHIAESWWIYLCGFALFRLFDITKPWPAYWADKKLISATGVMLDDTFAGIYAAICLYVILLLV